MVSSDALATGCIGVLVLHPSSRLDVHPMRREVRLALRPELKLRPVGELSTERLQSRLRSTTPTDSTDTGSFGRFRVRVSSVLVTLHDKM